MPYNSVIYRYYYITSVFSTHFHSWVGLCLCNAPNLEYLLDAGSPYKFYYAPVKVYLGPQDCDRVRLTIPSPLLSLC